MLFKYIPKFWVMELTLGNYYLVYGRCARFIRVTRKGFNFLYEEKNCCCLRHHLYAKGFAGKPIPRNLTTFKCNVQGTCYPIVPLKQKIVC